MTDLVIEELSLAYKQLQVMDHLNLRFEQGKIHCLIGPSGSGKTTLLNLIAGLQKPDHGSVTGLLNMSIAYVFQEDRLLPWATVEGNLRFVLSRGTPVDHATETKQIQHYLDLVGLSAFKDHFPHQLSGGMRQRVALARAFVYGGQWLLLDEPFKGLDAFIKQDLMDFVIKLCRTEGKSLIYVTHDLQEAQYMADLIHEFRGTPLELVRTLEITASTEQRRSQYKAGTRVRIEGNA